MTKEYDELNYQTKIWNYCCLKVDKMQFERVLKYIDIGKEEGATLLTGGKPCGEKGYYIEPTIFTDVKVSNLHDFIRFSDDCCMCC